VRPEVDERTAREELFRAHLPQIERVIAAICRRWGWFGDQADDFAQEVKLKLIEDDYAVLRRFRGKSRLKTFLYAVIHNLARDYLVRRHGKWRPSRAARRGGAIAIRLDVLLHRDRRPIEEAIEILRFNLGASESPDELRRLAAELPPHYPRHLEDQEALPEQRAPDDPEEAATAAERRRAAAHAEAALEEALAVFDAEDRLILKLHFGDGFSLAAVARRLGLEQKPLYRRRQRCLERLRRELERRGVGRRQLGELLGEPRVELKVAALRRAEGNSHRGSV